MAPLFQTCFAYIVRYVVLLTKIQHPYITWLAETHIDIKLYMRTRLNNVTRQFAFKYATYTIRRIVVADC
jgi:hypothetical protein